MMNPGTLGWLTHAAINQALHLFHPSDATDCSKPQHKMSILWQLQYFE